MQRVSISVVITTYNRAALLADALQSVAASRIEDGGAVEVIVVDNNSTDDTPGTVAKVQSDGFPFALRYVLESNQGLSYARNRGADESTGTYIAFMDDDQLLDEDYLSCLVPAFRSTGAVCVGGRILYYNIGELPRWLSPFLQRIGQCDYGENVKILGPADEKLLGGNMSYVRRELIDIGKFDVSLGRKSGTLLAGEEFELQARLHAAGKRVAYHPSLVQYHYFSPARKTKRYWRRHHFDHGRTLYRTRLLEVGQDAGQKVFGAPPWLWRSLITRDLPRAVWSFTSLDAAEIFDKQLDVWTNLGRIREAREQSAMRKRQ